MVLEVDRFERLDERKGEKAADSVLVSIARYLQETVRITDAVGRWGAGQFCVIMPDTELRAATLIADHLRERIGYKTFAGESGREFQVTCSVGLAQWNRPTETPREFPERLERALDTAREIGGNTLDAAPYRSASPELPSLSFEDGQPDPSKWGIPRTFFVVPEHIDQQVLIDSVS
jgi:diguanylate cyclase